MRWSSRRYLLPASGLAFFLGLSPAPLGAANAGPKLKLSELLSPRKQPPPPDKDRAPARPPAPLLLRQDEALAPARRPVAEATVEEMLLDIRLNGRAVGAAVVVLSTADGDFLVPEETVRSLGLLPPAATYEREGTPFFSLRELAGVTHRLDPATQTLEIEAPAGAFAASALEVAPTRTRAARNATGGFFNYFLSGSHAEGQDQQAGLFELGVYGPFGFGIATAQATRREAEGTRGVRLETAWEWDDPDAMTRLRVGDSVNNPGLWGSALRFGGVQYTRDFRTQPRFITFPLPTLRGDALLPSAVDVYFNDSLVTRQEVQPGPFSIGNVPTITGQGELRMVVRDALGREQVVAQPIYSSINLLKEGLTDFSYEAGWLRRQFGTESNAYGPLAGSVTYRRGLSDALTGELHAQGASGQAAAGAAADFVIQPFAAFNAAAAASHGDPGTGTLLNLGASAQFGRIGLNLLSRFESEKFRQVGADPRVPPPSVTAAANLSVGGFRFGSWNLAYAYQDPRVGDRTETALLGYSVPVFGRAFFQVLGVRNLRPVRDTSLTFSLTIPFGGPDNLHTLELTHLRQDDGRTRFEDSLATLTRALPSGPGWGYRLQASTESELRYAELDLQAGFGTYAVSVQRRGDQDRVDYSLSGGLGVIGGKFFASRQIIDSFGLASVGGVEGVRLYADGQLIGRTGPDGTVIVPTLRGYDINQLRLDPADLPMDVAVGSLKLSAVPYARSGLLVEFPVKKVRSAVLRLTLPDGTPVPAGAQARVAGVPGTFPVALEGEVFISELGPTNMLTITWAGRRCAVSVVLPDTADPLPDLGSFLCRPEAP